MKRSVVDQVLEELDEAPERGGWRRNPAVKLAGAAALGAPALAGLLQVSTAHPAAALPAANKTYVVNVLGDPNPADTTGGACATGGPCTLRQAVNQYNADPSGVSDTITFSVQGTFGLGAKLTIDNMYGDSLTIDGNGPSATVLSGRFGIGSKVSISDVEFTGATGPSSAITQYGELSLSDSVVAGNSSSNGGAGISNFGYVEAMNDTFSGNSTTGGGSGGAVFNDDFFGAENDTFSGNSATGGGDGGAVWNDDLFAAQNVTFSANSATGGGDGGAVFNLGAADIQASIFAGNSPGLADNTPDNCAGVAPPPVTDEGYNVADDSSCHFGGPGANVPDSQVALSPLGNNGGPTQTEAIASNSVAASIEPSGTCPTTDERGYTRPAGSNCSGGAFQVGGVPPGVGGGGALPPADPLDLTASDGPVTLNWLAPVSQGTSPVTSYDVFRFTSNTAATEIATVTAPTTTYTDSSAVAGTTYSYYVEAVNAYGISAPSNIATITPTAGPGPSPPPSTSCAGSNGNAAFVCALYEDLLGRSPDPGGSSSWQAALSSGESGSQVALGIMSSQEYRSDLVSGYYEHFLGRPADAGGLSLFTAQLASGATDEQVIAGIVGSPEFYADAGSTNSGYVNALYEDLLGRPADPSGSASWQAALSLGESRSQVALGIMSSQEYLSDLVSSYYRSYLNRAPDPGGLATFVGQLASGATDEQVIAAIVGSQEFYNDAPGA